MKLRCFKVVFPIVFHAEVLGVLIAVLPMGVFAASTMNSGRLLNEEPSIEFGAPVATTASEISLRLGFSGSQESIAESQERETETNFGTAEPPFPRAVEAWVTAEVDQYLWAAYERSPTKQDSTGDFTWKDAAAAAHLGMSLKTYVIGGMDRDFKVKLYHLFRALDDAGLAPGITSGFRDDYRQSIASGNRAATDRSYHGGSRRGGFGHGLAADLVSVKGETRSERWGASESLWKWIDAHGKEFGIGRPYLDRDPPHAAPIDGEEYANHRGVNAQRAGL